VGILRELWRALWSLFLIYCFFSAFILLFQGKTELGVLLLIFFSIEKINMRLDKLYKAVTRLAKALEKGEEDG